MKDASIWRRKTLSPETEWPNLFQAHMCILIWIQQHEMHETLRKCAMSKTWGQHRRFNPEKVHNINHAPETSHISHMASLLDFRIYNQKSAQTSEMAWSHVKPAHHWQGHNDKNRAKRTVTPSTMGFTKTTKQCSIWIERNTTANHTSPKANPSIYADMRHLHCIPCILELHHTQCMQCIAFGSGSRWPGSRPYWSILVWIKMTSDTKLAIWSRQQCLGL